MVASKERVPGKGGPDDGGPGFVGSVVQMALSTFVMIGISEPVTVTPRSAKTWLITACGIQVFKGTQLVDVVTKRVLVRLASQPNTSKKVMGSGIVNIAPARWCLRSSWIEAWAGVEPPSRFGKLTPSWASITIVASMAGPVTLMPLGNGGGEKPPPAVTWPTRRSGRTPAARNSTARRAFMGFLRCGWMGTRLPRNTNPATRRSQVEGSGMDGGAELTVSENGA